ncbi:bifunctional heptose 7-phosphate kinase/heptose 1-phosphate adenyltransferase [Comamonas sp. NLF-1-9]|uniref:bifunctional heptose 7-phosphate kinase/heptose 1-phosphate adenyltransferase n=1 Tax=Comamonas sp. NLF-1-9 TaxID=2853163 RepID=UPI00210253F5|nr:PfkB family carbohydrate kinase [Comamonas sp. NLF-1-9]
MVGDSMLDRYWEGAVERISPEAPVPVLRFGKQWQRAGGAANVAVNLSALGSRVTLATLLGEDEAGDDLVQLMSQAGVALHAVRAPGLTTTEKIRAVCSRHQLLRVDFERAPAPEAVQQLCSLVGDLLGSHPWVVLSDYRKGSLAHCEHLIAQAIERGCRVMVDPKGSSFEQYRGAWLLKPNEKEAAIVAGSWADERGFSRAMTGLRSRLEVEHLLVTRGERGMSLFSAGQEPAHIPAMAREVFDVSGAGDTVLAALASYLATGETLHDAIQRANLAAGIAVAKFGTAVVTRSEIRGLQHTVQA